MSSPRYPFPIYAFDIPSPALPNVVAPAPRRQHLTTEWPYKSLSSTKHGYSAACSQNSWTNLAVWLAVEHTRATAPKPEADLGAQSLA